MKSAIGVTLLLCLFGYGIASFGGTESYFENNNSRLSSAENSNDAQIKRLSDKIGALESEIVQIKNRLGRGRREPDAVTAVQFTSSGAELDDPFLGAKANPVIVMAFTDLQCNPCRSFFKNSLPQLKSEFVDKDLVKFIPRDFPLVADGLSSAAATLANCAGEQGKYWAAHDALFVTDHPFTEESLNTIAKNISGINLEKLERCRKSGRYTKEISLDISEGRSLGAKGAPGFFIGYSGGDKTYRGRFVRGAQPWPVLRAQIQAVIDEHLKNEPKAVD